MARPSALTLTETLKVRLDAETAKQLEAEAERLERPTSYVARMLIRDGLAKRRTPRGSRA